MTFCWGRCQYCWHNARSQEQKQYEWLVTHCVISNHCTVVWQIYCAKSFSIPCIMQDLVFSLTEDDHLSQPPQRGRILAEQVPLPTPSPCFSAKCKSSQSVTKLGTCAHLQCEPIWQRSALWQTAWLCNNTQSLSLVYIFIYFLYLHKHYMQTVICRPRIAYFCTTTHWYRKVKWLQHTGSYKQTRDYTAQMLTSFSSSDATLPLLCTFWWYLSLFTVVRLVGACISHNHSLCCRINAWLPPCLFKALHLHGNCDLESQCIVKTLNNMRSCQVRLPIYRRQRCSQT